MRLRAAVELICAGDELQSALDDVDVELATYVQSARRTPHLLNRFPGARP
ncbi:hypothetical protein KZO11_36795 [Streptomyces anulatus]|nr:hypothetical protein [Streptomyces anulatus]QYA98737.1 hypothetical protein KZO11_36795 [Streptomyces anulatus]